MPPMHSRENPALYTESNILQPEFATDLNCIFLIKPPEIAKTEDVFTTFTAIKSSKITNTDGFSNLGTGKPPANENSMETKAASSKINLNQAHLGSIELHAVYILGPMVLSSQTRIPSKHQKHGRIQRLKGIIPAKLISADLGAPSLSSPLDRVSGEGESSLVNDFPIVKKAGTDSVAFPLVDDKDERTTVTDNNNFGEIGPTMELYAEPSITGKQAEVDMDIPTYAHVVLDKMIEPCLTADRVSDGEDVVIGEMQSSEGEEGERDEVDGPVMDQSEEGPVASESKGEVRGRRVEACKVFENVPQSKTNGPGAGYGHSGFVQNGAGQSWADIVGNREICYPRPLVSESNGARSEMELEFIKCSEDSSEEINVNKGTKRGGAENKEDKETDMDSDSGWHRVNKKKYGNRRKSQEKGQTVGKTKAQPSQRWEQLVPSLLLKNRTYPPKPGRRLPRSSLCDRQNRQKQEPPGELQYLYADSLDLWISNLAHRAGSSSMKVRLVAALFQNIHGVMNVGIFCFPG
ncbi:hypothetical protein U1Q18_040728 [Sarracenia purpurea var. burkii]